MPPTSHSWIWELSLLYVAPSNGRRTLTSGVTRSDVIMGITVAMAMLMMTSAEAEMGMGTTRRSPTGETIEVHSYCEWESFNATCELDEVIIMDQARYGRMRQGKCVQQNYGHIGCGTDVMPFLESKCSGQRTCVVSVISFHEKRSCPKDFKSYLEASYYCLKVASDASMPSCTPVTSSRLPAPPSGINLTTGYGYISSAVAEERGFGSSPCPWSIRVHPHQRLNITLLDFSPQAMSSRGTFPGGRRGGSTVGCRMPYALIVDREASPVRNITICSGHDRETNVYLSYGSRLDIYLTLPRNPEKMAAQFLIRYEAVGCPPLDPPYNAWLQGDRDHAIVQCNETDEAWFLTCKGTRWIGLLGNCTIIGAVNDAEWRVSYPHTPSFPFGLLIVVALGVAIGVAVGLVMLVSVLAYMKRRRRRRVRSRSNYLLKNVNHDPHVELSKAQNGIIIHGGPGGGGGGGDRSPMLKRAVSLGNTHTQRSLDYLNNTNSGTTTWHLKRTVIDGPCTMNGSPATSSECCPVHRSADDLDVSPYIHTALASNCSTNTRGSDTTRSLNTFKPRSALRDLFNPLTGGNSCPKQAAPSTISVTRYSCPNGVPQGDETSPYYFKLDPISAASSAANGRRIAAENAMNSMAEGDNSELKPDVLPGCAECQEQNRVPNTVV